MIEWFEKTLSRESGKGVFDGMKVCFFARVPDKSYLEHVEFYKQDINILQDLGFDVVCATRWSEIPWNVDFFFIWWWTWAFIPLIKSFFSNCPTLITGPFDHMWRNGKWDFDFRPWRQQKLIRFALKQARTNVFISQLEYERVPTVFSVSNPCYSPLIVDTTVYHPGDGIYEDIVFTTAWMQGLNAERKCLPEIIMAARKVLDVYPKMRFIVAGEKGSYYPKLAKLSEELGLADRVIFPGAISKERKIELLQRCKVYLQPTRYEGFGLAILEAMSCGAAVVTSPAGAVPEVVGDAAMLIDGTSPDAIAGAVIRLLKNESFRNDLGKRARNLAEVKFPYQRRKRDLEKIIESLLQER